jgi:hypothetical protein
MPDHQRLAKLGFEYEAAYTDADALTPVKRLDSAGRAPRFDH